MSTKQLIDSFEQECQRFIQSLREDLLLKANGIEPQSEDTRKPAIFAPQSEAAPPTIQPQREEAPRKPSYHAFMALNLSGYESKNQSPATNDGSVAKLIDKEAVPCADTMEGELMRINCV